VDFAKQGRRATPAGEPAGLPNSESFFDSFAYKISGRSTIVITSTWPWIAQHIEGRGPTRMTWLTQEQGVYRVPIVQDDGTVVVRFAPFRTEHAWVHPGFARHTFLERGVRKGREEMAKVIIEEVKNMLAGGDPTR
jgi:hypothetical protein